MGYFNWGIQILQRAFHTDNKVLYFTQMASAWGFPLWLKPVIWLFSDQWKSPFFKGPFYSLKQAAGCQAEISWVGHTWLVSHLPPELPSTHPLRMQVWLHKMRVCPPVPNISMKSPSTWWCEHFISATWLIWPEWYIHSPRDWECTLVGVVSVIVWPQQIRGLGQERHNSSALTLELHLSCTIPIVWPQQICGLVQERRNSKVLAME